MTLQQLQYALVLLDKKSFNQAAKQIGISQPALSVQIKKLEEEMGLTLFDRSQKKIIPTANGIQFLDRAKILVNESNQLRQVAQKLNEEVTGELRIGVIPTLAPYLLPLFVNDVEDHFHLLNLYFREVLTDQIIKDISSGILDGGIIATPVSSNISLEINPLFYEGFKLFVSHEHPLFTEDNIQIGQIKPEDIWLLSEGNCFRDQVHYICNFSKNRYGNRSFLFESSSIESLCRVVEFKGGITFLPELSTMHIDSDREDMIKEIKGKKRVREISMIYRPNHVRKNEMKELGKMIRNNLPKSMLERGSSSRIPTNVLVD